MELLQRQLLPDNQSSFWAAIQINQLIDWVVPMLTSKIRKCWKANLKTNCPCYDSIQKHASKNRSLNLLHWKEQLIWLGTTRVCNTAQNSSNNLILSTISSAQMISMKRGSEGNNIHLDNANFSAEWLSSFCRLVRTFLFHESFPGPWDKNTYFLCRPLEKDYVTLDQIWRVYSWPLSESMNAVQRGTVVCCSKPTHVSPWERSRHHRPEPRLPSSGLWWRIAHQCPCVQQASPASNKQHNHDSTVSKYHTFNTRSIRYRDSHSSPADW